MSRVRRTLPIALLVLASSLAVVACDVDALVTVDVEEDGSGTVLVELLLDAEAAGRLGDPAAVRVDDLRAAGWRVEDPAERDGGGIRLAVTKEFASPDQLADALGELGGTDGLVSGVRLGIDDGFATTRYDFVATLTTTGSLEQFSDPELTAALGGLPLGRTPEELAAESADAEPVELEVRVVLPGGLPETDGTITEGAAAWRVALTSGTPETVELASSTVVRSQRTTALLALGALVSLVGLGGIAWWAASRRREA